MRLKVLSIRYKVEEDQVGLHFLPIEILEHLLTFCDIDSLYKARLTSSRLFMCTSRPLAERFQLDWKICVVNKMTPVELLKHHPLKYFANARVHVSKNEFGLSWSQAHHLNPFIIPTLLRLYPDGNMSLPTNMIEISNHVFGILDNGAVIKWNKNGEFYTPVVFPCFEKVTHVYEDNGFINVYAIRYRDRLVLIPSENPINRFARSQLLDREIRCLYNRSDIIFAKLDNHQILLISSSNPDVKIPEKLLNQRVQTVCPVNQTTYLAILENGELVSWGKGLNQWDFSIPKHSMITQKVLSITPNFFHNVVNIVLEDRYTIMQSGFLWENDVFPSKRLLQLKDRVKHIYSTKYTHVAWLYNGGISVWGRLYGGEAPVVPKNTAIRSIHQTREAFAILLEDGHLLVFGNANWGGRLPFLLENRTVIDLFSTQDSFLALLDDHTIFGWGSVRAHSSIPSRLVGCRVKTIFSNQRLFLALLENGLLYCWKSIGLVEKEILIPDDRRIKNVIPIDGDFVVQLDNDALILVNIPIVNNNGELVMMQYQLPLPEGRRLAVMDREL